MKRHILYIVSFFLSFISTYAINPIDHEEPSYFLRSYLAEDGLSHNTVWCALQDSYGFIWLGTSNGLNRFDGREFITYRRTDDRHHLLGSSVIHALLEDKQQNIWIGTERGVYIYDRKSGFHPFETCTQYGVSVSCEVEKIRQLPNGLIWMATLGQGVFIYNPENGELWQNMQQSSFVWDMEVINDQVYTSSSEKGILCFDTQGSFLENYPLPADQTTDNHCHINNLLYFNHTLWACTNGKRLFRLNPTTRKLERFPLYGENNFQVINCLTPLDDNTLLVGTNNGLLCLDTNTGTLTTTEQLTLEPDYTHSNINSFLTDAEQGIWILTHNGATRIMRSLKPVRYLSLPTCQSVNTFCPDPQTDKLWMGTHNGLFYLYPHDGRLEKYPLHTPNNEQIDIRTLCLNEKELWIGSFANGVWVVNLENGQVRNYQHSYNLANTIFGNEIQKIYRCRDGRIYIGTSWGLCYYQPQQDNFRLETEVGIMFSVIDIYEDHRGTLWIATANNGILAYVQSEHRWQHFTYQEKEGALTSNAITTLFEDRDGVMWLGTNGNGLCYFDHGSGSFHDFSKDCPALRHKVIYAIEQDKNGALCLADNTGLLQVHPNNPTQCLTYERKDGLQERQFVERAIYKGIDGQLYFGGTNGICTFLPSSFHENEYVPQVHITRLSFPYTENGNPELEELRNLSQSLYMTDRIELPYTYNHFTVYFAALSFTNPQKNRYTYRLEGSNPNWAESTENNSVSFANLPPGKYRLQVRGSNNDQLWSPKEASLWIVIRPPWWLSGWAYLCYVIGGLCLASGLTWRWYIHLRKKYHDRMEEYRILQEKETYESKISFFIQLVHEIRTPLSLIKLPLELLQERKKNDEQKYLDVINHNVNYLLGITNELLDFQKMETGNMQLHLTRCNLSALVHTTCLQFATPAELKHITLNCEGAEETNMEAVIDPTKVTKILVNLIGNAMKYAHSRINIKLWEENGTAFIQVEDDGPGVTDNEKEKIFHAFYQAPNAVHMPGSGLGLAYARAVAEHHGGKLEITESDQPGAAFLLSLPLSLQETGTGNIVEDTSIALPAAKEDTEEESQDWKRNKKYEILIAEDNAALLAMVSQYLGKYFTMRKAEDGIQALEILEQQGADIVISDIMMPRMDGLELCKRIKTDIRYSHIPVMLLTAKTLPESKVEGYACGADIYIEKPFTMKQLRMQIENLIKMRIAFHQWMQALSGQEHSPAQPDNGLTQKDYDFIGKMNEIIDRQIADSAFSVDTLATEMNMSRSNFYRKLKALSGMAPNDYLRTYRLNKASELLKQGMRVTKVSEQTGFNSVYYFGKCFKNQFGVTPKEFSGPQKTDE